MSSRRQERASNIGGGQSEAAAQASAVTGKLDQRLTTNARAPLAHHLETGGRGGPGQD